MASMNKTRRASRRCLLLITRHAQCAASSREEQPLGEVVQLHVVTVDLSELISLRARHIRLEIIKRLVVADVLLQIRLKRAHALHPAEARLLEQTLAERQMLRQSEELHGLQVALRTGQIDQIAMRERRRTARRERR